MSILTRCEIELIKLISKRNALTAFHLSLETPVDHSANIMLTAERLVVQAQIKEFDNILSEYKSKNLERT